MMQVQRTNLIIVMAFFLFFVVSLSKGDQTAKNEVVSHLRSITQNRVASEASQIASGTNLIRKIKKRLKTEKQERKPPTPRQFINLDPIFSGFNFNESGFLDTGDTPSPVETTTISSRCCSFPFNHI